MQGINIRIDMWLRCIDSDIITGYGEEVKLVASTLDRFWSSGWVTLDHLHHSCLAFRSLISIAYYWYQTMWSNSIGQKLVNINRDCNDLGTLLNSLDCVSLDFCSDAFHISERERMSGNIQQQRAAVEQLRREANIKRISVSQAVEDIKVSLKHIQIVCKRFILLHSC